VLNVQCSMFNVRCLLLLLSGNPAHLAAYFAAPKGRLQLTVYLFILTVLWTRTNEQAIRGLNFMVNPLQMSTVNWLVLFLAQKKHSCPPRI